MKQNYMRMALMSLMMGVATMVMAISYPKYPAQTPVEGGKYVLCNLAVPTGYMSSTSWDGAYYFLGKDDSNYANYAFTAHQAEDGTWFFTTSEQVSAVDGEEPTTTYTYVGVPGGTDNLLGGKNDIFEPAYFALLPGIHTGFYQIQALEGNNLNTQGLLLHLNAGGQYFVFNEPNDGGQWYPDFYGGIKYEEDGVTPIEVYDEERGLYLKVMADSTSMNWAFVLAEDVPAFVLAGNAYAQLNNYERQYCSIEGYADGFQASLNAVLPTYESTKEFSQELIDQMKALLQAKIDLYNQILKAENMDVAELERAIEAAKEAFNTKTAAEDVTAALEALTKVMNDYSLGLGDITPMGKNMSFEDLSSQNGNETSGCQPAPTGWNVYVNGNKLEEGSTAGLSNWHGINSDCTGYKDGNYGFGLWMPNVPEYEISQTITGLEKGTYTITAGLMVDRRRTTQRLFGNLNSTLFASEFEYEEGILPGEYKTYADLSVVNDDRTMQEMSVRAYVYDGTLTFGVRTNGDISAALRENGEQGDGWFKVDNFTITKDGYIEQDAQDLYDYLSEQLEEIAAKPMDSEFRDKMTTDYEDLDEGIAAFAALLGEAEAQVKAYEPLGKALEQAWERLTVCEETGYVGTGAYADVIGDVNDKYSDGDYRPSDIAAAVARLEEAYQECLRSGVDEGADVSDLILNRSFEDLSAQGGVNSDGTQAPPTGWTLRLNGVVCETADDIRANGVSAWCAINSGDAGKNQPTEGTHVWGIWNSSIPSVELSQTLTGLEPGTYTLTADVMADGNSWAGDNMTTQRIFAQNVICLYGAEGDYDPEWLQGTSSDDIYQAWRKQNVEGLLLDEKEGYEFINYGDYNPTDEGHEQLRTLTLHFGVDESGTATIGFRTDNLDGRLGEPKRTFTGDEVGNGYGWFKIDNFTLYYESHQIPTCIKAPETATNAQTGNALYDLSGRRVERLAKGVYIRDGKKIIR